MKLKMFSGELLLWNFYSVAAFFAVLLCGIQPGVSTESACCDKASGSCLSACNQLSLVTLAAESNADARNKLLRPIQLLCPSQLVNFWECMNETLTALLDGANWEGRYCCSSALTEVCKVSCLTAQKETDLENGCRRSDESAVFQCLEKQEEYEKCCGQSGKPDCKVACRNFLREPPASLQNKRHGAKKRFNSQCEREPAIISCVANLTHAAPVQNPEKNLPCCSRGRNQECQEACRRALKSTSSDRAMMETLLEKGCGQPRPDDKMWQCFLQNAEPRGSDLPSKIDRLGMDAAKLHCCHRGTSQICRKLCHKTYSREWTGSWSDLDRVCLSAPNESSLRTCVEEVEEPCELGCEGLSFCSAFNNRPSELFRRCNAAADLAARQQFEHWRTLSYIPLSDTLKLPLKDLGQCATEKLKAVACALQLKPCHPKTHVSQICRSDCVSLLHECVDSEGLLLMGGHDVTSICELFSPPPGSPCISISTYAQKKTNLPEFGIGQEITRPCRSRPCNSTEICHANRNCPLGKCSSAFTCSPGCSLGEVSRLNVATGTWVRVPGQNGCQRLCRCGEGGRMEQCSNSICETPTPCWLGRTHIDHGSHFWLDCNLCSCRAGETICSKRQCGSPVPSSGYFFTSSKSENEIALPCNCPSTRKPVCGSNGKTYNSACLAKCGGLSDADISEGECSAIDACEGLNCGNGRRCIRTRQVCLVPQSRKCSQFQCVPVKCEGEPWYKASQPVCDTSGRQHKNICSLATSGAMLSYKGPCMKSGTCSSEGPICGVDGETYSSECAAESQGIPKDYSGPCQFHGAGDGSRLEPACSSIQCPQVPQNCIGVTPAGACCPVCGGVLRVIYSPTQVLKLAELTDSQLITVEEISGRLSDLVQTAQCRIGVYLSLGTELIVIIRPMVNVDSYNSRFPKDKKTAPWTKVQLQACISETERLATLISKQSPVIQVDSSLSVLTAASVNILSSGTSSLSSFSLIFLLLLSMIGCFFNSR